MEQGSTEREDRNHCRFGRQSEDGILFGLHECVERKAPFITQHRLASIVECGGMRWEGGKSAYKEAVLREC